MNWSWLFINWLSRLQLTLERRDASKLADFSGIFLRTQNGQQTLSTWRPVKHRSPLLFLIGFTSQSTTYEFDVGFLWIVAKGWPLPLGLLLSFIYCHRFDHAQIMQLVESLEALAELNDGELRGFDKTREELETQV